MLCPVEIKAKIDGLPYPKIALSFLWPSVKGRYEALRSAKKLTVRSGKVFQMVPLYSSLYARSSVILSPTPPPHLDDLQISPLLSIYESLCNGEKHQPFFLPL